MLEPDEFIEMFGNKEKEELIKYAKVDPNYTGGRPKLIFDGEDTVTAKTYPYIGTLSANDRVQVIQNVVHGPIK